MNHIELFAGCGGLCLGLQSQGFELLFANELSPMASESFAYNFFDDMSRAKKTRWLSSNYGPQDPLRSRENPSEYPKLGAREGDISTAEDFDGTLIVGSIVQLNEWLGRNPQVIKSVRSKTKQGVVDLVSGGPPCQSFSMAGMRQYTNHRNTLPAEFAKFVAMVEPRFALLENVTGILRPFKVDGEDVFAWFEVAKAFADEGYVPLCLHVNAKYAGVPQNRPRFLMMLFKEEIYHQLSKDFDSIETNLFSSSFSFYTKQRAKKLVSVADLTVFDVENDNHQRLYKESFLRPLVEHHGLGKQFTVRDAIEDLNSAKSRKSKYRQLLDETVGSSLRPHRIANLEPRKNSPLVQRRFRIYQILQQVGARDKRALREAYAVISGASDHLSPNTADLLMQHQFVNDDGEFITFGRSDVLVEYLMRHQTKKQTQKALDPDAPAPAALSIPDDACHYQALRTLSVREMARIQSFPDNFVFRSKVTTGGQSRKFEVPQYTQVGNAVPPLLGRAIGRVFSELIARADKKMIKRRSQPVEKEELETTD